MSYPSYELINPPPDGAVQYQRSYTRANTAYWEAPAETSADDPVIHLPSLVPYGTSGPVTSADLISAPRFRATSDGLAGFDANDLLALNAQWIAASDPGFTDGTIVIWNQQHCRWRWQFKPVAYSYLRIWWIQTTHSLSSVGGNITSGLGYFATYTEDQVNAIESEWVWSPQSIDHFCVPRDFQTEKNDTWPVSSEEFFLPVPAINTLIRARMTRWSYLPNYIPPLDGSANGWPA